MGNEYKIYAGTLVSKCKPEEFGASEEQVYIGARNEEEAQESFDKVIEREIAEAREQCHEEYDSWIDGFEAVEVPGFKVTLEKLVD